MVTTATREAIFGLHADPRWGSPYWQECFRRHGLSVRDAAEEPLRLPPMDIEALRARPLDDFVSRKVLEARTFLVTAETSGFSGAPILTAFTEAEFHDGFVAPFLERAAAVGFPVAGRWLWAGPSGPHAIGKAVRAILRHVGGLDPLAIDFDPRWYRRLPDGSLSRERYLHHIEEQILALLERQRVDVLFTTPPVVARLAEVLPAARRDAIAGVHYGGMAIDPDEYRAFRAAFPRAVHLSGYGNSLFGMFPEIGCDAAGIEYGGTSARLDLEVVRRDDGGPVRCRPGESGQVVLSRYDESCLLVNLFETDVAERTAAGIRHPRRAAPAPRGKTIY